VLEAALEDVFGEAVLSISRFEEGDAWRISLLTAKEPDQGDLAHFESNLIDGEATTPPAPLPDTDWVAKVQADMPALRAGRFWIHGSHINEPPPAGSIAVRVDGTSAFGTGHHGSTQGCLLALDALARKTRPLHILDVGTGTGILAVAAARCWRRPVVASDIDPEAVRVARRVARDNGVSALVRCVEADGASGRVVADRVPYDLIIANILAKPLAAMAPQLARCAAPGGHLVLSGILVGQAQSVCAAYRNAGFVREATIRLGEWTTLQLERRQQPSD